MVQVLKDELRQKILQSASEEFANRGVKAASMRTIAAKSYTTVGNLYRYYENKEAILKAIINPAVVELKALVLKVSNNGVSFDLDNEVKITKDFTIDVKELATGIVKIYNEHNYALNILGYEKEYHEKIVIWINNVIINKIAYLNPNASPVAVKILARMCSTSIINGVGAAFACNDECISQGVSLSEILCMFLTTIFDEERITIKQ